MTKLFLLIITLLPITLFAQVKQKYDSDPWKDGATKYIWGMKITKLQGVNSETGFINISYKSHEDYFNSINKQNWTQSDIFINKNLSLDTAKGGFIYVYVCDEFPSLSNTYNLTVTVKDTTENELYSKRFSDKAPQMPAPGSILWTNSNVVALPVLINLPFFAYISDSNDPQNIQKYKIELYISNPYLQKVIIIR